MKGGDAQIAVGFLNEPRGIAYECRRDDAQRQARDEESLQVREALLGGAGTEQQRPKLPTRWTKQELQVGDRVDSPRHVGAEQP